MDENRQAIGNWGEELAARYLEDRGHTILERNYRTPAGEIDLVASQIERSGLYLVFVEVKTRTSDCFGYPEQAITGRKWAHLMEAIKHFLAAHPELDGDWRVDVIAIQRLTAGGPPEIVHFENVIFCHEQD